MKTFNYKGFTGSIETSSDSNELYGSLLDITDLVTYEAQTVIQLEQEFQRSVNEYLETRKQLKRES